ncbi:DUF1345 domain-containing protein [Erythrobacter sp. 3-20A1M]|uniref:DUF1345 domain-containing protein n=1 Tax=Erythrobacter sp. 3-20A1M TaxID=2653850 RepID=UPI00203C22B3|nr:DUF1345 domain-containing protein [Erythrobacter sp. 3-20A1M]
MPTRTTCSGSCADAAPMRIQHRRYLLFLLVMALAVWPALLVAGWASALLIAFDVGVIAFVLSCIPLWRHGEAGVLRADAQANDAGGILLLLITALISASVTAALSALLAGKSSLSGPEIALMVGTLLANWCFANLVFTFHYARLYWSDDPDEGRAGKRGGLDFPGGAAPGFSDFVNFAFVIGMTCQTADIEITGRHIRRVSTFHALFAFVFNLGILALTVNTLASV